MNLRDGLSDPPPSGRLVLSIWTRGGVPTTVGLAVKGKNERVWHSAHAVEDGMTSMNALVFNPAFWIDLSEMPPCPDERSKFPNYTPTKKSLVDFGWPLALPTGVEPVSGG